MKKRSHHKGKYAIRNGSDKESGGVRRGPRRHGLLEKILQGAANTIADRIEKEPKPKKGKSHRKGEYVILNGSDSEAGGVRRGPRRGKHRHKTALYRLKGSQHVRSHHKGKYHIVNGTGTDDGSGARRGPRLKPLLKSFVRRRRRANARARQQKHRAGGN